MLGKLTGFKFQPVAISEFVRQVFFTLALFGLLQWTDAQQMAVMQLLSLGLAMLTYNSVTSQNTLEKAGTSQAAVVKAADERDRASRGDGPSVSPKTLLSVLLAIVVGASVFTGCAARSKPPERQVAIISLQVISGVDAVAKTSQELHASKVLTDGQYKAVVTRLREVYAQTSRLADALKAYDQLASTDAASQVTAALNALAVLVPNLVADVGGPGGQKLATLVAEVNKLLIAIAQAVQPAPTARVNVELQPVGGVL